MTDPRLNPDLAPGRRCVLRGAIATAGLGCLGLGGCVGQRGHPAAAGPVALAPIRARADRLFDVTVCLRPFRAAGPRLEAETVGDTLVVHNYGHGGSGWSLSWGSAAIAVGMAMTTSPDAIAVLGCGALGLTAAITAQRAGARVTIYAKEFLPDTRSARATGTWSPDSRIALADEAPAGFAAQWETMARQSFKNFRQYLGLPGEPVEWTDRYTIEEVAPAEAEQEAPAEPGALRFATYRARIADLTPRPELLPQGSTPFDAPYVSRSESLTFNVPSYGHMLISDFLAAGGVLHRQVFHDPAELASLPENVVINCSGYGARELWRDSSITPVRGQIGWLVPQPDVRYGLYYKDVYVVARRDGICVQWLAGGDMRGYGDADETPNRTESAEAVEILRELFEKTPGAAA